MIQDQNITGVLADGYNIISPYKQDISFAQNDDGYVTLSMVNSLNQALSIAGGSFILTARNPFTNAQALLLTATILDAANGIAQFFISSDNSALQTLPYPYDIVYIDGSGNTSHVIGEGSYFNILISFYMP